MKEIIHKHALIKAFVTNPPVDDLELKLWLYLLVCKINMKVVIPPRTYYVEAEGNRGITGQIGIETSHCSIHSWDEPVPARIEMDVYSCADFDAQTVLDLLDDHFGLETFELLLIDRNDSFKVIEHTTGIGKSRL